jgi:pimeloyl-ACP methyl ester carboxylesterase
MINYSLVGEGPLLVLIHGFCEDLHIWDAYAEKLQKQFTVLSIDLPGFGKSEAEFAEAVTMEYFAKKVHDCVEHLNLEQKTYTMIGHSLGGYVTLAYADLFPEFLNGIGLFHSTAFDDNEEKKASRDKVAAYIKDKGVKAFTDNFVEPLFHVSNRKKLKVEIEQLIQSAGRSSLEGVVATTMAMKERISRIHVLEHIKVPVLFIIGKKDTSVTFDKSLEQCSIPSRSLVLFLENTGHMGMLERPQECLEAIKSFMRMCQA